jgi:hypothetical protein
MNRPALGRGRLLVVIGSIAAIVGLVPTWWVVQRTALPDLSGSGLQGPFGATIFLAAIGLLVLVTLPFASRSGESSLDRPASYVVLGAAAIGAFGWRLYEISQFAGLPLPTNAPGIWITGVGLLIAAWGVGDILTDRRPRDY